MIPYDTYFGYKHRYEDTYAGLPVIEVVPEEDEEIPDPASVAVRISAEMDDDYDVDEAFDALLKRVDTAKVPALVIGEWEDCYGTSSEHLVGLLVDNAARFPGLRSLFLGAISSDEAEISWIQQSDVTPLLEAFPWLERLEVRGGTGLALRPVRHESLRMLRFETGGLPAAVVRAVGACDLPALEHLDLWLGEENYGGDTTVADLAPILSGERLPALRHLGLQDSEIQDEIAAAVAAAPVVARLESLALSMGMLTDAGAEALLGGQPLTHLHALDLHHHFLTDAMVARVTEALPGVEVDLSKQEEAEEDEGEVWRYVAVSE
ncbi:STM4015 family protein [Microbispora catharanthi]|uniref:Leucine-rich repeat domain-containing protein n=1 Tax=Microbispora catharanthi TaxID=1712871 RepID=A0A5N6C393_9ACTN|nr:STM4015 family protein [Microbispora catharanthi]KAB8187172.1 leucine-rich repeat domain-containing protein [Microbispora catharanthi]